MKLVVEKVNRISNSMLQPGYLKIDVSMTEGQMLDAILTFLEHVPGPKWEEWKMKGDVAAYPQPKTAPKRA